jgi:hypothetical protein
MRKALVIVALLAAAGCAQPAPEEGPKERPGAEPGTSEAARDGLSLERAVVINAPDTQAGVAAEYRWIEKHYPGYRRGPQALLERDGRHYDCISIVTADGEPLDIYFDITAFFGKW